MNTYTVVANARSTVCYTVKAATKEQAADKIQLSSRYSIEIIGVVTVNETHWWSGISSKYKAYLMGISGYLQRTLTEGERVLWRYPENFRLPPNHYKHSQEQEFTWKK